MITTSCATSERKARRNENVLTGDENAQSLFPVVSGCTSSDVSDGLDNMSVPRLIFDSTMEGSL